MCECSIVVECDGVVAKYHLNIYYDQYQHNYVLQYILNILIDWR